MKLCLAGSGGSIIATLGTAVGKFIAQSGFLQLWQQALRKWTSLLRLRDAIAKAE